MIIAQNPSLVFMEQSEHGFSFFETAQAFHHSRQAVAKVQDLFVIAQAGLSVVDQLAVHQFGLLILSPQASEARENPLCGHSGRMQVAQYALLIPQHPAEHLIRFFMPGQRHNVRELATRSQASRVVVAKAGDSFQASAGEPFSRGVVSATPERGRDHCGRIDKAGEIPLV